MRWAAAKAIGSRRFRGATFADSETRIEEDGATTRTEEDGTTRVTEGD